jgi:hypothetical protein
MGGVTTTETLEQSAPLRCPTCGRESRGLIVNDRCEAPGCGKKADRELMAEMLGEKPAPVAVTPSLVASDPFEVKRRPSAAAVVGGHSPHERIAGRLVQAIRERYWRAQTPEERAVWRQAGPEAMERLAAEEPELFGVATPELAHVVIPARDGSDVPDLGISLRGPRMARKTRKTGLDKVGHEGRYEHLPRARGPMRGQMWNPTPVNEVASEPVVGDSKPAEE